MTPRSNASRKHQSFVSRYPKLGQAWEFVAEAGEDGPLDERTGRLLKLAISVGTLREEAVRSHVAKALASGITKEEVAQVVALAAGAISLQATETVFSWVEAAIQEVDAQKAHPAGRRPGMRQRVPGAGDAARQGQSIQGPGGADGG